MGGTPRMAQPLVELTSRPASDLAGRLRNAIIDGEFAPGQRLVEAELALQLGATRSAVRSAMAVLQRDGLVEMHRGRSPRVQQLTLAQAQELAELRQAIWTLVAPRAAARCTAADAEALRGGIRAANAATDATDLVALARCVRDLDTRIAAVSGHHAAQEALSSLELRLVHFDFQGITLAGRALAALAEVEDLITAVVAGDGARAAEAADLHFARMVEAIRRGHTARGGAEGRTVRTA